MKFENIQLGYDRKTRQWKLQTCCHTCGEVGKVWCFNEKHEYLEQTDEDFPCDKHFWEQEIKKARDGTSDFETLWSYAESRILDDRGITYQEYIDMSETEHEEIHKEIKERSKSFTDDEIKELIQEDISNGDYDFPGEVCKT